jgi:hypothetical protein
MSDTANKLGEREKKKRGSSYTLPQNKNNKKRKNRKEVFEG